METISIEQLEKLLSQHEKGASYSGSTLLSLVYKVPESKSKTKDKEKVVTKTVAVPVAMSGAEYEKKVNKFREKEGIEEPFKSEPPKGFQYKHEGNRMLMESIKKGEPALMLYIDPSNKGKVKVLKYEETKTGKELDKEQVKEHLTPSGLRDMENPEQKPETQAQKDIPFEKRFRIVRPYLKNIVAVKLQGKTYIVENHKEGKTMELDKELS